MARTAWKFTKINPDISDELNITPGTVKFDSKGEFVTEDQEFYNILRRFQSFRCEILVLDGDPVVNVPAENLVIEESEDEETSVDSDGNPVDIDDLENEADDTNADYEGAIVADRPKKKKKLKKQRLGYD